MTRKIFKNIIGMSFITFLVCFILIFVAVEVRYKQIVINELKNEAYCISHAINISGYDYLDGFESQKRISVISQDGTVIFDTYSLSSDDHSTREEIAEAINHGEGTSIRYSYTEQKQCIYYALRLDNGDILRLSGERFIFYRYSSLLYVFFAATPFLMALSIILAKRMSKNIVTPINNYSSLAQGAEYYEELQPLVSTIDRQNRFISSRISELRRRQEEFTVITENMIECFIVINAKKEIISYNLAAARLLGIDGIADVNTIDSIGIDEISKAAELALDGQHSENTLHIDGSFYRVSSTSVRHDDTVSGAVIVIIDVTEKEMRYEMRREFTGNVTHELKTPLTSIRGAAEMMLSGIVKPEDMDSFAKMIYDESGRLFSLVEDVLRLSELDEDQIEREHTAIDLYDAAESTIARLRPAAETSNITCTVTGQHAEIVGVRSMIDEIIYNLCDNAIKYNKPGGTVSAEIIRSGEFVTLSVTDSGIGIPKEHVGRIFERFYRVDKSRSREIGGTGLGLSIVKHAAMYHNASLSVESEEGVGTTFKITFKCDSQEGRSL